MSREPLYEDPAEMNLLWTLRRLRLALGRPALALFAATWLGLALQPCTAHALEAPAADAAASAGEHAGCDGEPAPPATPAGHDCPHCAGSAGALRDCASDVATACDAIGVPALVTKSSDLPPADPGAWMDLAVAGRLLADPRGPPPSAMRHHPPASARPLQQRFCTYLK